MGSRQPEEAKMDKAGTPEGVSAWRRLPGCSEDEKAA